MMHTNIPPFILGDRLAGKDSGEEDRLIGAVVFTLLGIATLSGLRLRALFFQPIRCSPRFKRSFAER
jgi:hypothetical protein